MVTDKTSLQIFNLAKQTEKPLELGFSVRAKI